MTLLLHYRKTLLQAYYRAWLSREQLIAVDAPLTILCGDAEHQQGNLPGAFYFLPFNDNAETQKLTIAMEYCRWTWITLCRIPTL